MTNNLGLDDILNPDGVTVGGFGGMAVQVGGTTPVAPAETPWAQSGADDEPPTLDEMVERARVASQAVLNPAQDEVTDQVTETATASVSGLAGVADTANLAPINPDATVGHNGAPPSIEELHKEFFKDVKSLGTASGAGAAALPRLAMACIAAAHDGIISTAKQAGGKDDATLIYEAYQAADSKKSEHTAGGAKANASKLRQLIQMGGMPTVDAIDVANRTVVLRKDLEDNEIKTKPLYAALVDVARAQLGQATALTDGQIKEACEKTAKDKSLEDEIKAIHKRVEKIVKGDGELSCQSSEMIQCEELLRTQLATFAIDADVATADKLLENPAVRALMIARLGG